MVGRPLASLSLGFFSYKMEGIVPTLKGSCEHRWVRMEGTGCESTEELVWLAGGRPGVVRLSEV